MYVVIGVQVSEIRSNVAGNDDELRNENKKVSARKLRRKRIGKLNWERKTNT